MDQWLAQADCAESPNRRALLQAALREASARFCAESTTTPIPVHEETLSSEFPHRITSSGLKIIEVALADRDKSLVG